MYLGEFRIDDYVTLVGTTHRFSSGAAYAPTSITYRVYEDATATEIVADAAMTNFDSVTGFYLNRIQCTAALGYEVGKTYTALIQATVDGVSAIDWRQWRITANVAQSGDAYAVVNHGTHGNSALNTDLDTLLTRIVGTLATGTHNPQSGDAYARLGAPSGASIAADIATRASQTSVNTIDDFIDTEVAAILAAVDTEVAAIKAKTDNLPANPAAVGSQMDLVNAPNATAVTALQNGLATAAALDAVDNFVDTEVGAIKAVTDKLDTAMESDGGVYRFTTNALEQAPSGTGASAAAIADAVWDEVLGDHLTSGSTGAGLNAAGAAGDPWSTTLPGAYGAGTAGNILGNRLVGTLASGTHNPQSGDAYARIGAPAGASLIADLGTVHDNLDNRILAVKAKTDNLPASPAAVGSQMDLIDAPNSLAVSAIKSGLATQAELNKVPKSDGTETWNATALASLQSEAADAITAASLPTAAQVKTALEAAGSHLALIKAKTDNLPAAPAAVGSPMDLVNAPNATAVTALQSGLATASDVTTVGSYIDTEVAAIKAVTDKLDTALEADGGVYRLKADAQAINGSATAAVQLAKSAATIVSGAAVAGTLSTTAMTTDLTEATDDHYAGRVILWVSGALKDQATNVTAYDGTTKTLTFTAVTEPAGEGDAFLLVYPPCMSTTALQVTGLPGPGRVFSPKRAAGRRPSGPFTALSPSGLPARRATFAPKRAADAPRRRPWGPFTALSVAALAGPVHRVLPKRARGSPEPPVQEGPALPPRLPGGAGPWRRSREQARVRLIAREDEDILAVIQAFLLTRPRLH